jgi:hypothetical protein
MGGPSQSGWEFILSQSAMAISHNQKLPLCGHPEAFAWHIHESRCTYYRGPTSVASGMWKESTKVNEAFGLDFSNIVPASRTSPWPTTGMALGIATISRRDSA